MEIREARKEDCREIWKLIQEYLALSLDVPKISLEVMERDGFVTDPPLFKGIVAVDNEKIVGQVFYCYDYCPWEGKSMLLRSLYLTPQYRNKGIGGKLFDAVVKKAADEKCCRLDFLVQSTNPAQEMYKRRGAVDITKSEMWHAYRLFGAALKKYQSSA